jgi:glycosyltransferase involved in cell wall biosynthesis
MKILHVTNIVSHHQIPLARQLAGIVGPGNFRFCATDMPHVERLSMGWSNDVYEPWIIRASESGSDKKKFEEWWDDADIVICGSRRFDRMSDRLNLGKLCFYMSERWWKPPWGKARLLNPTHMRMAWHFNRLSKNLAFNYLAIGPYAEKDISYISNLKDRIWRWGYFTEKQENVNKKHLNKGPLRIIWVGRMLRWKRVGMLISALSILRRQNIDFKLTIIGGGPEKENLQRLASRLLNIESYEFNEQLPAVRIPEKMRENEIYVLPSTAYEGWGAVINEAMSCGCVVVASKESGAAAAMIEDQKSGYLFESGNLTQLVDILVNLARNSTIRQSVCDAALDSINNVWSPATAAKRITSVGLALLSSVSPPLFDTGPMSRSEVRD